MVKKKEEETSCCEMIGIAILIICGVVLIMLLGTLLGQDTTNIRLNQETADDICKQITNDSTAVASDEGIRSWHGGKLICIVPSYDSTQNIIVKSNNR